MLTQLMNKYIDTSHCKVCDSFLDNFFIDNNGEVFFRNGIVRQIVGIYFVATFDMVLYMSFMCKDDVLYILECNFLLKV